MTAVTVRHVSGRFRRDPGGSTATWLGALARYSGYVAAPAGHSQSCYHGPPWQALWCTHHFWSANAAPLRLLALANGLGRSQGLRPKGGE